MYLQHIDTYGLLVKLMLEYNNNTMGTNTNEHFQHEHQSVYDCYEIFMFLQNVKFNMYS